MVAFCWERRRDASGKKYHQIGHPKRDEANNGKEGIREGERAVLGTPHGAENRFGSGRSAAVCKKTEAMMIIDEWR